MRNSIKIKCRTGVQTDENKEKIYCKIELTSLSTDFIDGFTGRQENADSERPKIYQQEWRHLH